MRSHARRRRPLQQLFAQTAAASFAGDGDRVQTRQRCAAMKQYQCVAEQSTVKLGDQQLRMGAGDHPLKAAAGEPVGGETLHFQGQQRWQIFNYRQTKNSIHMTTVKVA
jgi:hypothetical protein